MVACRVTQSLRQDVNRKTKTVSFEEDFSVACGPRNRMQGMKPRAKDPCSGPLGNQLQGTGSGEEPLPKERTLRHP